MKDDKSLPWLVGDTKFVDVDRRWDERKRDTWQAHRTVIAEFRSPKGRCLIFDTTQSTRDGYLHAGESIRAFMEFSTGKADNIAKT